LDLGRKPQHVHDPSHPGARDALLAGDVAVFERPLGIQCEFNGMFAVGANWGVVVAVPRDMDDPEIDLRLDPARAGSHTGTFGEP